MRRGTIRALAIVLAVALLLLVACGLAGCAGESPAAQAKAKCFANQKLVEAEMKLFKEDSGLDAPLNDVVGKLHAGCPSGGTYSYDAAAGTVTCSIHGHHS